ncbi:LuxR C-terminal-related transcriptional regulator [Brumimicrobium oceani]|uniref:HTH luxR-type domain-containing protein n=1 Tax=Brumimicrobium oceani TaxID=2100725 RepID=A0A2U2XCV3_9FLAO|nr:LuxR C-terminal-related transcriptional regulator [Brumimicrobium oceani]PWH85626.1 hypothetical protein DIT68_08285 [Brumimicrobium oceani]
MKKISLHIIFLLGFLFVLTESTAQENYDFVEQKWYELQEETENAQFNEVKILFEEFARLSRKNKQDSLLTEGIIFIGNYYKNQDEFGDRIKWYQYAIDSLCNEERFQCVQIRRAFSKIYTFIEQYEKSNELLNANLKFLEEGNYNEATSSEYSTIAKNHLRNNNFNAAEKSYFKGLAAAEKANSSFYILSSYNNLGFFYSQIADLPKAESYYLTGIEMLANDSLLRKKHAAQMALLKGNLGAIYLNEIDKVEKGIQFLNEDINYNLKSGDFELAINASAELAGFYFERKNYKLANKTLKNCLETINQSAKKNQNLVPIYYLLFKVNLEQKRNDEALEYFKAYDSLKTINDALREERRFSIEKSLLENILNVQLENQNQQIKLKNQENEVLQEKNKHFFYRLIIGLISFVTLAVLILLYSRKRISLMRVKKELAENQFEIEKLEKEKTKLELKYKNKDLTDFAIDISRKQEVLTDVKSKLNEILKNKSDLDEIKKEVRTLIHYTNNNMLVDEQLKEFQENVEEVNYKFLDQLGKMHPELTELDKNVCGLIRLGLSNKEIATMRNVSYKAIRMSRYRIRKKLDLPAEVNLVEFLKSIA